MWILRRGREETGGVKVKGTVAEVGGDSIRQQQEIGDVRRKARWRAEQTDLGTGTGDRKN